VRQWRGTPMAKTAFGLIAAALLLASCNAPDDARTADETLERLGKTGKVDRFKPGPFQDTRR